LHTVFALAASPHATSPCVEALCVVLSNLAPKVAAKMPLAETCFGALKAGNGGEWEKKGVNI